MHTKCLDSWPPWERVATWPALSARRDPRRRCHDTRRPRRAPLPVAREIATGGVLALGPRGRTQTNVYFVQFGSSWALIDAGLGEGRSVDSRGPDSVFGARRASSGLDPADALPPPITRAQHSSWRGSGMSGIRASLMRCRLPMASFRQHTYAKYGWPARPTGVVVPLMRAMGRRRREAILAPIEPERCLAPVRTKR